MSTPTTPSLPAPTGERSTSFNPEPARRSSAEIGISDKPTARANPESRQYQPGREGRRLHSIRVGWSTVDAHYGQTADPALNQPAHMSVDVHDVSQISAMVSDHDGDWTMLRLHDGAGRAVTVSLYGITSSEIVDAINAAIAKRSPDADVEGDLR